VEVTRVARSWWVLGTAVLASGSCTYLDRRLADLHDSVLYSWHHDGLGLAVEAKVGPLAVTGGAWFSAMGWGKDTWWQTPGHVLRNHGNGVPWTTLSPLLDRAPWSRVLATSTWGNHPSAPDRFDDVGSWFGVTDVFDFDDASPFVLSPARRISDLFGVEVGVFPLFWGLRLGVNAAEFADFLLGFVWIDVFGDDGRPRPASVPFVPAPPVDPRPGLRPGRRR
jgi:hypothetical protein